MTYKHLAHAGISTAALLFSTTLFAYGFCDDPVRHAPLGGHCSQVRETFQDMDGRVSADYSDLDLKSMLGNSAPTFEFELNATKLFPPALFGGPETQSDMTVFELQLTTGPTPDTSYPGRQALLLTVSRLGPAQWILKFDWLAVASNWSIVTHAAPVLEDTWEVEVPVAIRPRLFKVRLAPSLDWHSVNASVGVLDDDSGAVIWSAPDQKTFSLAQQAQTAKPWRIRSGVLAGMLTRANLVSHLTYLQPEIKWPYR